jgi:hypothetical protein
VVILGAYVMPTVLIGIVSINFDEANRRAEAMQEMDEKMERIAIHAKVCVFDHVITVCLCVRS